MHDQGSGKMRTKAFFMSFASSMLFLSTIFISTMLSYYREMDWPFLLHTAPAIVAISAFSSAISLFLIKNNKIANAFVSMLVVLLLEILVINIVFR